MALSNPVVPVHFELLDSGVGAASIIFHPLPEGSRKPTSTAPYRSTGSCVNSTPRSLRRSKASLQLSTNSTRGGIARFATISCKVRAVAAKSSIFGVLPRPIAWQSEVKRGADAWDALRTNCPSMLIDNALDCRQANAGTLKILVTVQTLEGGK